MIDDMISGFKKQVEEQLNLVNKAAKIAEPKYHTLKNGERFKLNDIMRCRPVKSKIFFIPYGKLKTEITYLNGQIIIVDCNPSDIRF